MNKKRFFATCTLVAFGATMMPALAFATDPNTTTWSSLNIGADTSAYPAVTGISMTQTEGTVDWLSDGDTIAVKVTNNGYSHDGGDFTLKVNEDDSTFGIRKNSNDGRWEAGYYEFTISNADGATDADKAKKLIFYRQVSERTTVDFGIDGVQVSAEGTRTVSTGFGTPTNSNASDLALYSLGTDKNARSSTAKIDATFAAANSTKYKVTVDPSLLTVGEYYGVAGKANDIKEVFQYTETCAQAVAEAIASKEGVVDTIIKNIPNPLTKNVSDGTTEYAIVSELSGALTGAETTIIQSVSGDFAGCQISDDKQKFMLPSGSWETVTGDVTLAVTKEGVTKTCTIPVTVTKVTNDFDKAVEQYITDNKLEKVADKKYTVTLAKGDKLQTGEFSYLKDGAVKTGKIALTLTKNGELNKYITAGEVTATPTEDVTGAYKVVFTGGASDEGTTDEIEVTVTIKADGSTTDKEEAAQAVVSASTTFQQLANAAMTDNTITDEEFANVLAAYNELLQAYMAYISIK